MRIGELAALAGTTTRTLRYYEARGLITARRDANGHRSYTGEDLRLLRQIRLLQGFGFELEETRPFVECLRAGDPAAPVCTASLDAYRARIAHLDACIDDLAAIRDDLRGRLERAEAGAPLDAPGAAPAPLCAFTPPAAAPRPR
ncbi:MerR family transcriptional regulator [Nocardiopsis trehalosi]|jgi:DNA-binding transcriptional MerR regulator|uniref:MerR family transcriptional regulator n=1 Tax=Nocardiopsis trehalosi TaxID=109329 RepID=UPI000832DFFA|nr:MerR family transcriptional regulator [Nocardiopsis trehalosi]